MLQEYLERYSGNEYIFKPADISSKRHTLVFKILGKSELIGSRETEYPNMIGFCNYKIYTNCQLVDIVDNNDIDKKVESINVGLNNNSDKKEYADYKINDIIGDGLCVIGLIDIDEYISTWFR